MSAKHPRNRASRTAIVVLLALPCAIFPVLAQQPGISRKDLLQENIAAPGLQVVQVRVGFAPHATAARHSHPGEEVAYVLTGRIEYRIDGKPPVVLQAGDTLFIPAHAVHGARNLGTTEATELATYIVERGKPLVVPAVPAHALHRILRNPSRTSFVKNTGCSHEGKCPPFGSRL